MGRMNGITVAPTQLSSTRVRKKKGPNNKRAPLPPAKGRLGQKRDGPRREGWSQVERQKGGMMTKKRHKTVNRCAVQKATLCSTGLETRLRSGSRAGRGGRAPGSARADVLEYPPAPTHGAGERQKKKEGKGAEENVLEKKNAVSKTQTQPQNSPYKKPRSAKARTCTPISNEPKKNR